MIGPVYGPADCGPLGWMFGAYLDAEVCTYTEARPFGDLDGRAVRCGDVATHLVVETLGRGAAACRAHAIKARLQGQRDGYHRLLVPLDQDALR